ncbi:MAG: transporter substrate-binding domain-containing protein [Deltaproteobacteria bacterium]
MMDTLLQKCRKRVAGRYQKIAAAVFFLFIASIFEAFAEYPPDIRRIIDRGTLTVAMYEKDMPPFFMQGPGGVLIGIDVRLAEDIAKNLGVRVQFNRKAKTFNEVIDIVARGEADIGISLLSATPQRAIKVLFSEPYITVHPALLVNRLYEANIRKRNTLDQLLRKPENPIGVIGGSAYERYARDFFPGARVIPYPDWVSLKKAVVKGEVFAVLQSEATLNIMITEEPELYITLRKVELKGKEDYLSCAIPVTHVHFLKWVNTLIAGRPPQESTRNYLYEIILKSWGLASGPMR